MGKKKPLYENPYHRTESICLRIKSDDKTKLQKHFKLEGLINFSTGIRQIIYKYMDEHELI